MKYKNIYVLSAPVNSGKTTTLLKWSASTPEIYGIFTPIIDSKRVFMDANSNIIFEMETNSLSNSVQIGRYNFSKKGFEKANDIIISALKNKAGWLVIDEIGPLELKGEGFYSVLNTLLHEETNNLKILLVVRSGLIDEVIHFFNLGKYNYNRIGIDDSIFTNS